VNHPQHRMRRAKILATLGPASSSKEMIRKLVDAGADVFRLNFSHGTQEDHAERYRLIREVQHDIGRPIGILMDLQGPKLRVGRLKDGRVTLKEGASFRLDLDPSEGDDRRANLPHPEIFAALKTGTDLLLDDGKLRLRVESFDATHAITTVMVGGVLSDRKGVNVPGVVLPISPLTAKDRADLEFGLKLGVDWVALSFVQRPDDIREAKALIGNRAWIMAKLEKPSVMDSLREIVTLSDGIMVARGDLGVELPPQQVPVLQRRMVTAARAIGRPVVVATQMLESMITMPVPTRAEASDVATAIYEGVDAVMLSAESASGKYPIEAVQMMDRIITEVEADPAWREGLDATHSPAESTTPDAICCALRRVSRLLMPVATVAYTVSGFSCLKASRERPTSPILAITGNAAVANRLAMAWGVHPIESSNETNFETMMSQATHIAVDQGFAAQGDNIVIIAGLPSGSVGSTNLLHVARVT
jgi:pyruvate kinase